jgi:hypothetical protein
MPTHILTRILAVLVVTLSLSAGIVEAQKDTWIPANPMAVVPNQISVSSCNKKATVTVDWMFREGAYRVEQPPVFSRSGQTITLDSRVEETTGVRTLSENFLHKDFDIGTLEPGTYTLVFQSWGSTLKLIQFTILDDQPAATFIDDRCFFVSQHYRDFLQREPDGHGLAFWTNEIATCGSDAACIESKRINVSVAFLLSMEFRATGDFVYKTYRTAFGRPPTYAEFVTDVVQMRGTLVVGQGFWGTILGGIKDLYAMNFSDRPDFQARYNGLTNTQYVDTLFATQGITPTQSERSALIASLNQCPINFGCPSRFNVLRKIVDHPAFDRKVFNEEFVTMEYFGYLRRDPDPQGFAFWLAKLNQFNGNYIEAEMVKSFISSDEYRGRFLN